MAISKLKVGLIAVILVFCIVAVLVFVSLNSRPSESVVRSRLDSIPVGAVKVTPSVDVFSPVSHSDLWLAPVPLGVGVTRRGLRIVRLSRLIPR